MTLKCTNCHSVAYCSIDCQRRDAALHNLLCEMMGTFLQGNPRPENTLLTTHKLAILLPQERQLPELMWVEFDLVVKANGTCKWEFFDNLGQLEFGIYPEIHYVSAKGCKVGVCRESTNYHSKSPNECLSNLMEG